MRGEVTSIDKAAAEIICGYAPAWGNSYDAVFLLTPESEADSNQWTVPEELNGKTIRVVLIGGGTGGASGQHGSDDTASGGKKGAPGGGGRIREIRLTVAAGATYTYHCGSGGAGGAPTSATEADEKNEDSYLYVSNSGSAGTATTFTPNGGNSYSSADGVFSGVGFYDTISGNRYATPGLILALTAARLQLDARTMTATTQSTQTPTFRRFRSLWTISRTGLITVRFTIPQPGLLAALGPGDGTRRRGSTRFRSGPTAA